MLRLDLGLPREHFDELSAELFAAGASGVEELPDRLRVYAETDGELDALRSAATLVAERHGCAAELWVESSPLDDSWQNTWLDALTAAELPGGFVMRPTHDVPAPDGERTIWYEARPSFGTGDHGTTRLAARALLAPEAGARLLDVGAGTGVLSFVALRSGFAHATAVDIDEESIRALRANAELNGVPPERLTVLSGSADAVSDQYEVVVANIVSSVLYAISRDLRARVAPGGRLVLTGLLSSEIGEIVAHFEAEGLQAVRTDALEPWALVELTPR